jgi:hypothetical protein
MKPRILLLTCPYYYLDNSPVEYLVPAHLLQLGSFLRDRGYYAELYDVLVQFGIQHDEADLRHYRRKVAIALSALEGDYDLIGISCYTSFQYQASLDLAEVCRSVFPNTTIVVGGYHPTAVPTDFIFPGSAIDCVVKGEGENALLAILNALESGDRIPQIIAAPVIFDVNELPELDFTLIEDWSRYDYYYDYFSRGCPFSCRFCMEAVKEERRWRPLDPKRAVSRLRAAVDRLGDELLAKKGLVMLNDAIFGLKKSWVREVLEQLTGCFPHLQFFASPRVDVLDKDLLRRFQAAGFSIDIPVEHGAPAQLERMAKTTRPAVFLEHTEKLLAHAHNIGLPHHTHWVMGHPGETCETLKTCREYMQRVHESNDYGMTEIFYFKLYPGSWLEQNWATVADSWGAQIDIPEYWKQRASLDEVPYHIRPSTVLSRQDVIEWVENEMLPLGKSLNVSARIHHERCCGTLRTENAPWIL